MDFSRAYRQLLKLFPADYRVLFAEEMYDTFARAADDVRGRGFGRIAVFAIFELFAVVKGASYEWIGKFGQALYRSAKLVSPFSLSADLIAKLTSALCYWNASFRSRCGPDLRMMRPIGISREEWYRGL